MDVQAVNRSTYGTIQKSLLPFKMNEEDFFHLVA